MSCCVLWVFCGNNSATVATRSLSVASLPSFYHPTMIYIYIYCHCLIPFVFLLSLSGSICETGRCVCVCSTSPESFHTHPDTNGRQTQTQTHTQRQTEKQKEEGCSIYQSPLSAVFATFIWFSQCFAILYFLYFVTS